MLLERKKSIFFTIIIYVPHLQTIQLWRALIDLFFHLRYSLNSAPRVQSSENAQSRKEGSCLSSYWLALYKLSAMSQTVSSSSCNSRVNDTETLLSLRLLTFIVPKPYPWTLAICKILLPSQVASAASMFLDKISHVAANLRSANSAVMHTCSKPWVFPLQENDTHTTTCGTTEWLLVFVLYVF